jgi:predicted esterase
MSSHPALKGYQRTTFQSTWVADYMLRRPEKAARLAILLHGYSLRGEWMFHKLEKSLPDDMVILSPSAPFPVLKRTGDEIGLGYSWYFYDARVDEYWIDMKVATDFVVNLVKRLGLETFPSTILGFSQGGFLAPLVAASLPSCKQVIGIASEFLVDEIPLPIPYRMDQIHGDLDDTVLLDKAARSFAQLKERGVVGEFRTIPGLGHKIDGQVRAIVRELTS